MDISTNRISLTFDDAERMEKKNVSVQDAKDGGISQIQVGATMDCSVQEAGKHHIVYTEAEAKQLQKQNMAEAIMLYVMGRYTYEKESDCRTIRRPDCGH